MLSQYVVLSWLCCVCCIEIIDEDLCTIVIVVSNPKILYTFCPLQSLKKHQLRHQVQHQLSQNTSIILCNQLYDNCTKDCPRQNVLNRFLLNKWGTKKQMMKPYFSWNFDPYTNLNTEPFLCHFRGLRYLWNTIGSEMSYWPIVAILA